MDHKFVIHKDSGFAVVELTFCKCVFDNATYHWCEICVTVTIKTNSKNFIPMRKRAPFPPINVLLGSLQNLPTALTESNLAKKVNVTQTHIDV